jgi:hypothetical protein
VVAELYKGQSNTGQEPNMFHYRESRGPEIDLMINRGDVLHAIEIKSGATASTDFFKHFRNLPARLEKTSLPAVIQNHVIYGGEDSQQRSQAQLLSWKDTLKLL